ncbi:MAG: type 1 glutamine amidotransferase domain-containing protein [Phormidesmis sp.]
MSAPRILIVLTSHKDLGNTGKPTGFWLEEFSTPYYAFTDAGATVTLTSIQGGEPPLDPKSHQADAQTETTIRFQSDKPSQEKLANTIPINEVQASDYDAIFLPGGHGPMWDFPTSADLINLIEAFDQENKVIASVCHGVVRLGILILLSKT